MTCPADSALGILGVQTLIYVSRAYPDCALENQRKCKINMVVLTYFLLDNFSNLMHGSRGRRIHGLDS